MVNASDLKPTVGNVLVKGIKPEAPGGLALPDSYQEENPRASVVSVHPSSEGDYSAGDVVYIVMTHSVVPLKFDGDDYFLVSEESILAYVPLGV